MSRRYDNNNYAKDSYNLVERSKWQNKFQGQISRKNAFQLIRVYCADDERYKDLVSCFFFRRRFFNGRFLGPLKTSKTLQS